MQEMNGSDQWFCEEKGERRGVDTQRMVSLIHLGKLIYGRMIWRKELDGWNQLEIGNTSKRLHRPSHLTGASINNTLVWLPAFASILCYLIEVFGAGAVDGSNCQVKKTMKENRYWYIPLVLNIALSLLAEKRLKALGTTPAVSRIG
ncbi:DUF4339 domain-containing protein [Pseudomonas gingeri]|uniref:DUF4339 domain-containing protein n=1 Tax=Pseudomonas gingeri TaxID=117681 RepID=A0A7Y7WXN8_9PSED|nr:DUF4339 domain-containing protein [Pseudomonas gingeri]NWB89320.1 DUF4339 domain-containing protein [Pseudomonas gingeri]